MGLPDNIKLKKIDSQIIIVTKMIEQEKILDTLTVQMKNWLPFVLGPAFAMLRTPGPTWDTGK